ncbi:MAG: HAD-IA family hydrolase [Candidatus Accumulibacter sp.]|jgi:phosphoglycolate phosphatase|nr:HAD-IA family hydrolase [Accumulibacter sp.]
MAKRFELLVFDWDGTLFDSTRHIARALQSACRDLGLPEPSDGDARQVIGLELSRALRHAVPDLHEECLPSLAARYRHHYLAAERDIRLFPGIRELIGTLHAAGLRLAVATGKSRSGLERALASSGLGPCLAASRCADDCPSKPHPRMLEELMEELAVPGERTLMIGDTTHDIQMAANAGVAGLAVSYGAHARETLVRCAPLACVDDVAQLSLWLERNALAPPARG